MAGHSKQDPRSLRYLLEEFVDVHKSDMFEITGGHLNEGKLWNPSDEIQITWKSSSKPPIRIKPPSKLKTQPVRISQLPPIESSKRFMTEAVMDFMLGPTGGIGSVEKPKNTTPVSAAPEPSFIDKVKKIPSDQHLTQELELPELMLPVFRKKGKEVEELKKRKTTVPKTERIMPGAPKNKIQTSNKSSAERRRRNREPLEVKHDFITTHHALPTKSDQYRRIREFEGQIIRKRDAQQRIMTSGAKEIARIDRRLRKKLSGLEARHIYRGIPSFYTLQAYSDCWDGLIDHSETYGNVLQTVKEEYDKYISLLLDLQESQNGALAAQLNSLSADSTHTSEDVQKEERRVDELEKIAKDALQENERLRKELKDQELIQEEQQKFHIPDRSKTTQRNLEVEEKKRDLEQQVEELHAEIDYQLKNLEEMEKDRKENYVPLIVCHRLADCVKETENEIQKILKQNDFLERKIDTLEEELEDLLEKNGIKEKETRTLWMKINTSKIVASGKRKHSV